MNELEQKRNEIDAIDKEMAKLFEERMKVCDYIAEYKKTNVLPVFDKEREEKILADRVKYVKDDICKEYYIDFMKDLMKLSCKYQERKIGQIKVAYSGTEGAFGYMAAKEAFNNANLIAYPHFAAAYHAVENGEADCAVLPIENSYAGDVGTVMDLAFSGGLFINRVIDFNIVHNLVAKKGASLDKIKTVVSHPQALEQCEEFIKEHGFATIEYANTALAAKYVKENCDETVAAIASDITAEHFDLEILQRNINSGKSNTTRFAVFSKAQVLSQSTRINEKEHFIIVFTTKNEAGTLAQALNIIGAHDFNMRNLRSRPMKDLLWSYYFFVEAEGNIGTREGQNMMRELSAVCARLKLVGTYR